MKKKKILILLTVIIFITVITFLILLFSYYRFTYNINSNINQNFILDNPSDNIDKNSVIKNNYDDNKNLFDKIIDIIDDLIDRDDEVEEEEEKDPYNFIIEPIVSTDSVTDELVVADSNIIWDTTNELDLFKNRFLNNDNLLSPGSSNAYHFELQNKTKYNVLYTLSFVENNLDNVNLKYRLRINGEYVSKSFSDIKDIILSSRELDSLTSDDYVLEWVWFDSDNDTYLGNHNDSVKYNLRLNIVGYSTNHDEIDKVDEEIDDNNNIEEETE